MKIYIAEDEPLASAKLKLFLEKAGIVAEVSIFGDGMKLKEAIEQQGLPDIIFLDIQMPNLTGLQFLQDLRMQEMSSSHHTDIIITSAYDQYAIDGFNFGVTDYLLKPYTLDRLRQALAKVHVEQPMLSIRADGRNEIVNVADIVCLEALKDYTRLSLTDGRIITTLGTLTSFEQQLPSSRFTRIQRSYIIGIEHIRSYNTQSVVLTTGAEVPIGKTFRESFESSINHKR